MAQWREGLLAQAVLAGGTRGYRHHPQLARFQASGDPVQYIAEYLRAVQAEAACRGYRFDVNKIRLRAVAIRRLRITEGQLQYEWAHLMDKLAVRAPAWHDQFTTVDMPEPHPLFRAVPGEIATWEVAALPPLVPAARRRRKTPK